MRVFVIAALVLTATASGQADLDQRVTHVRHVHNLEQQPVVWLPWWFANVYHPQAWATSVSVPGPDHARVLAGIEVVIVEDRTISLGGLNLTENHGWIYARRVVDILSASFVGAYHKGGDALLRDVSEFGDHALELERHELILGDTAPAPVRRIAKGWQPKALGLGPKATPLLDLDIRSMSFHTEDSDGITSWIYRLLMTSSLRVEITYLYE